jgi:hypothetical protein
MPPEALNMPGYGLMASPILYPGQMVRAYLEADSDNHTDAGVRLYLSAYHPDGTPFELEGPEVRLPAGGQGALTWQAPDTGGAPIFEIGLQFDAHGIFYLDALTWDGPPDVAFSSLPGSQAKVWRKTWINGVQHWEGWSEEPFRIVQNEGRGMLITGSRDWQDYQFHAEIRPAFLSKEGGIAVRVQGTHRFYGLLISRDAHIRLIKELDGRTVLAEAPFPYELWQTFEFCLQVDNGSTRDAPSAHLRAWLDGKLLFDLLDAGQPLLNGGVALVIEEGHLLADQITVKPILEQDV